ncbi:MAG: ribonuclease III [Dehalococcoidales bacterium]|nr:MAG: ribonuclease III [Dehalococcoidales bacterium]
MADLDTLQQTLGVYFKDISLLKQALVHGSYINESPGFTPSSNERLEFLGDAVLGLIVAQKLYQDFPHFAEGKMTKIRAAIVRRDTLVRMARNIDLENYLYLGKGEEASGGRYKPTNLASAFEAVIAAIFLDQGLTITRDIILRLIDAKLQELISTGTVDYKSELQEFIQARKQQSPTYEVIEITGPDHNRTFTVEVRLGETVLGRGSGKNKKAAESKAARSALEQLSTYFTE